MHELHAVVSVSQVPVFVCKQLRKTVIMFILAPSVISSGCSVTMS